MAELELVHLEKTFGEVKAVSDINFVVKDGEFVTLLGPSGCGKTTILRMIAGFTKPSDGKILLNGVPITSVAQNIFIPPERRSMSMVFQSYAIWPHMNIFQNVGYPLRLRKLPKQKVRERVIEMLSMVKLDQLEQRMPDQISGGQQQRVALARALVMEPEVLLLDEPLSNLDAKLRESMRYEIMELTKRLKITVVYVTHDQVEAMSMSDRIVVLNNGKIEQIGSAPEIYQQPANRFVAEFIGLANFIPGIIVESNDNTARVKLEYENENYFVNCTFNSILPKSGKKVIVMIRPEFVQVNTSNGQGSLPAKILRQTYLGDKIDCLLSFGLYELRAVLPPNMKLETGQQVYVTFGHSTLLDA